MMRFDRWRGYLLPGVVALTIVFLLAPILVVILTGFSQTGYVTFPPRGFTFRWFLEAVSRSNFSLAILTSLKVSAVAASIATIGSFLAALGLRRAPAAWRSISDVLFTLPLVVPTISVGLALLLLLSLTGLGTSFWALAAVQGALGIPFAIRFAATGLESIPESLYWAAQDLGCSSVQVVQRLVWPLLRPSIMAAASYSFVVAFDELTVALFLAGPRLVTLPVAMYTYVEYSFDTIVVAMAALSVVITASMVFIIQRTIGLEALGT